MWRQLFVTMKRTTQKLYEGQVRCAPARPTAAVLRSALLQRLNLLGWRELTEFGSEVRL